MLDAAGTVITWLLDYYKISNMSETLDGKLVPVSCQASGVFVIIMMMRDLTVASVCDETCVTLNPTSCLIGIF